MATAAPMYAQAAAAANNPAPSPAAAAPAPAAAAAAAAAPNPNAQAQKQAGPASNGSLYVGELNYDITEANLYELFSNVGQVSSIRVCRDAVTRRSLGYAYVNFHHALDAERALDTLNYAPIRGRPCRIMWSQRDPQFRKSHVGNVFIKSLDKEIDNKALYDTFSAFGNILSCKVMSDENGSKGYGFVHYETQQAADLAIAKVNGMLLNDKKVFVGPFIPKKERMSNGDYQAKFTNVFVKNFPEETTEDEVKELFAKYGEISSLAVMQGADGKGRGFGFVCFAEPDDARKAVEELNGSDFKGKALFCGRAQKKSEREADLKAKYEALKQERLNKYQGVNLYVKNLDDNIDDERLRTEFQEYGTVTSAKVMRDEKGESRGFGFVCFATAEEATKAVAEMNSRIVEKKPLYVGLAERKEVRKQKLEVQYTQRHGMRMQPVNGAALGPYMGGAGQPVFYNPNLAPQQRGVMYQQQMAPMARPRWNPQQGSAGPRGLPYGQQNMPGGGFMGQPGVRGGAGGPRAQRGQGGNQPRQQGAVAGQPNAGQQRGGQAGAAGAQAQGAQGGRGYKYNTQVRNGAPGQMGQMQQAQMVQQQQMQDNFSSALAEASPEAQKQMLGERLFPKIQEKQAELAGKITGMLLEMDNGELLHLLESESALNSKVEEAVAVLKLHQQEMGAKEAAKEQ